MKVTEMTYGRVKLNNDEIETLLKAGDILEKMESAITCRKASGIDIDHESYYDTNDITDLYTILNDISYADTIEIV